MVSKIIKTLCWSTAALCFYIIIITGDPRVFGATGLVGFIATWILFRWDMLEDWVTSYFEEDNK